jgi:uncharacterized protein (TIGR03435 family)
LTVGKKPPDLPAAKDDEATLIRQGARRQLVFQGVSVGVLANYLHQIWRTTVLDHIGITGKFDFALAQTAPGPNSFGDYVRVAVEQ